MSKLLKKAKQSSIMLRIKNFRYAHVSVQFDMNIDILNFKKNSISSIVAEDRYRALVDASVWNL